MAKIKALARPRNLFNCIVSRHWREVVAGDTTCLFDGEQLVIESREFPDHSLREITLADGTRFARALPGGKFTCESGARLSEVYGDILFDIELYTEEFLTLFGCAAVNVVGFTVVEVEI